MAFRHSCPHAGISGSPRCRADQPGKGPKRCPGRHASLMVEEGRYGVLQAEKPEHRGYVVRFITERVVPNPS